MINPERPERVMPPNVSVPRRQVFSGGDTKPKCQIDTSILEPWDDEPGFVIAPGNPLSRWQKVKMFFREVFR